jgi:hypothetical protein
MVGKTSLIHVSIDALTKGAAIVATTPGHVNFSDAYEGYP